MTSRARKLVRPVVQRTRAHPALIALSVLAVSVFAYLLVSDPGEKPKKKPKRLVMSEAPPSAAPSVPRAHHRQGPPRGLRAHRQ